MKSPKIAVLGTGAQGAAIGADLTLAGLDVTFIEQWPAHVEAMRQHGITVNLPTRTIKTPVKAIHLCQVAELRERFDIVFLVVKAYDSKWSTQLIEPYLKPDSLVCGVQNGMTIDAIAGVVGTHRTIGAVIDTAANIFIPGIVNRQNDHTTSWFAVGGLEPSAQARASEVADLLRHSGTVEISDDIRSAKWMKLVVNAAMLVPSAILDLPLSEAPRTPGMLNFMSRSGYEAIQAAVVSGNKIVPIFGLKVDVSKPEKVVDDLFAEVLNTFSMEDTLSTILQDWRKGRRAEVDDIHGEVIRQLTSRGIPVPVNERVFEVAHDIELGKRRVGRHNLEVLLAGL